MKDYSVFWLVVLGIIAARVLSGCGPMGEFGNPDHPYYIASYNMDGTKMIVNGVTDQKEPSTFDQDQYTIQKGQRLLVRFEALSTHVTDIKNSWDNQLHMRLVPTDGTDVETLRKSVKLCPVTKNWMMLATWYQAHPFNHEGKWNNPGGDFDSASCIAGEVQNPDGTNPDGSPSPSPSPGPVGPHPSPTPPVAARWWDKDYSTPSKKTDSPGNSSDDNGYIDRPSVIFDIKNWFLSNPEGRNNNFGFILISESTSVQVFGDHSNSYSPRIYWKQPKNVFNGCTQNGPSPSSGSWNPCPSDQ